MVGIAGMSGAIGGMLIATAVGLLLQLTGSYVSVFLMAASSYLFALLFIHLLAPRLAPANLGAYDGLPVPFVFVFVFVFGEGHHAE